MENPYASSGTSSSTTGAQSRDRIADAKSSLKWLCIALVLYAAGFALKRLYGVDGGSSQGARTADEFASSAAPILWMIGFFVGLSGLSQGWRATDASMALRVPMFLAMLNLSYGTVALSLAIVGIVWFLSRHRNRLDSHEPPGPHSPPDSPEPPNTAPPGST